MTKNRQNKRLPRMGKYLPKTKILLMILVLVVANAASLLHAPKAHAFPVGTQLTSRSLIMSDSRIGTTAGATSSYQVNFKPGSATYTVKGIIVDFCNDSPVVGSGTCTLPPGFTVGASPTVTTTGATGGTVTDLGGTWTASSLNSGRTLKLTNSTGVSINPANASPYAFTITGVTNPTANATFYARIITYTLDTGDIASYAAGTEGSTNAKDYGSVALSTANSISLTARVPEQLQFCVSGATMTANCTGMTTPTLTIGHGAGSAAIVDASAVDTVNAFTQVSTNATTGVVIRMRNLNGCTTGAGGLLRAGATTTCDIPAVNTGSATAAAIVAGTAAFGMYEPSGSLAAGFTAPAPYTGTTSFYGMDATTANSNVSSTYGSIIQTSTAPSANSTSTLTFGATASATTPAGLYTATMVLVCTGTF
jgi:hypothetical protein